MTIFNMYKQFHKKQENIPDEKGASGQTPEKQEG